MEGLKKRFSVKKSGSGLFYRDGDYEIDNTIQFIIETVEMKLNQLSDENEQLKQFKEKVFTLIEEESEEHPYLTLTEKWNPNCKNYHSCRGNHEMNVFYASRHTLLEKLREELSHD